VIGAALVAVVASGAAAQVELRGGSVVQAPVETVTIEGVAVGGDQPRLIGWDSVKVVHGPMAEEAASFMPLAERAWRARLRLARGDSDMACPLFEELFQTYAGRSGPTALMAAEGRLRCLTRQREHAAAVGPWIEALRLRREGFVVAGDPPLLPVIDEATGLVPGLPPIWLSTPDALELARSPALASEDEAAAALAGLFQRAARFESGLEPGAEPPEVRHPGVELARQVVMARTGNAEQRKAARERLVVGLSADMGTWREAWRRAAIGRSLLREESDADRTAGVFQLLHLPARFARTQPYLTSVALAEVGAELDRRGDQAAALAMRTELMNHDPASPALGWLEQRLSGPRVRPVTPASSEAGPS